MRLIIPTLMLAALGFAQETAPAPAPAAATAPALTLQSIRKLYIDKMTNDLDQYIRTEILKQMNGRLAIVLNKEDADAIMTGVGESRSGTGAAITGRYLGLHDNASASVSIVDKDGKMVIWSSEAGDRSLLFGVMKRGGPRKVADRLVSKLKKSMEGK
jgi:hypothetical protein